MENAALWILAFAITGFLLSCVLLKRNDKVYAHRMALLKTISQRAQDDITAHRDWRWRYDLFEAVSYTRMWLEWWKPLESFYDRVSLLRGEPLMPPTEPITPADPATEVKILAKENRALTARLAEVEAERASLTDVVNTCLREAYIPMQADSIKADLRPLVEQLLFALNRMQQERDALRTEVDTPASYWSEYFEAGLIRSRDQLDTDHDRMWWDWLQGVKARGWKSVL